MKKKIHSVRNSIPIFILLILLLCCFTEDAYAGSTTKMYTTEQTHSYFFPREDDDYITSFLGEGERVSVSTKVYMYRDEAGNRTRVRTCTVFGKTCYIPADDLTFSKPKNSYSVKEGFFCLSLKDNAMLYSQPTKNANSVTVSTATICTLGQTKYWYTVYHNGRVFFIRKDSADIKSVKETVIPNLQIKEMYNTKTSNAEKRAKYFYSLIPHTARIYLDNNLLLLQIGNTLSIPYYENNNVTGYAKSTGQVYLKEIGTLHNVYRIETSILHELGHILSFPYIENALYDQTLNICFAERTGLSLHAHYQYKNEYIAEAFEIFVKSPDVLLLKAPNTYKFFIEMMESNYLSTHAR